MSIPVLVEAATSGSWQQCVDAAVAGASRAGTDHVLVGHSGAGPLLPLIAYRLDVRPTRVVFVDAGVPPERGEVMLAQGAFSDQLRRLAINGRLPKWSEWFGPEAMRVLVPNSELRDEITAELPELPLSYFETPVPMPDGWSQLECTYVLVSDAYRQDAAEARSRGWPTFEVRGSHLAIVTRPREIAAVLLQAVDR